MWFGGTRLTSQPAVRAARLFLGIALCGLAASAYAQAGLVAHYTFEEGPGGLVKDSSGNGNDGKIVGDVTYVKLDGGKGYALKFNTGSATVDCGKKPSLDLTDAVTLELWFHPETAVIKGEGGVMGKVMGSYCMSYSGKCWFYAPGGGNYGSTNPLSLSWHHVVATFDGATITMYLDGKLQGVQKSNVAKLPHGENFYLRYPATYMTVDPEYKCMMDDVRVYNRALSEEEVAAHYRQEARTTARQDATWFEKVKLTLHTFPQSATLVAEADVTQMNLLSPGCTLKMELRNAAGGKTVAQCDTPVKVRARGPDDKESAIRLEFQDLERLGISYWTLDVKDFPAGNYDIGAVVTDKNGKQIGTPSSVTVKLPFDQPDWIKAYEGAKVLNNLAAELLSVGAPQADAEKTYAFSNPRAGWVFISSTASAEGADKVAVSIDSATEENAVILHAKETEKTLEAMRYLPVGAHKLIVRCTGAARPSSIVVRAVPELMVAGLGYTCGSGWPNVPILPCFGHYNMEYLDRIGLLANMNAIIEQNPVSENASYVSEWRRQGKKLIDHYTMWPFYQMDNVTTAAVVKGWTECHGLAGEGYDGVIADEFSNSGHGGIGKYPFYAEALRQIAQDPKYKGKLFYLYCMPMYGGEASMDLLKAVIETGNKWAEEKYLVEQPTEQAAKAYMNLRLRENLLGYHATVPDCARHMITTLGFMSAPPETLDISPAVDFKVYMDMQMNLLANDPVFFGLYGIHWYHNGYVDEEDLRWTAKLFRHYGIEGKRDRLTSDPYIVSHIKNPDFDQGAAEWTLAPAEPDAISVKHATGYGSLQTRCSGGDEKAGDNFLLMRRSAKAPNRASQKITRLTPGRTYSVKMFTADYNELQTAKSTQNKHAVNIRIDGVELIPEKGFQQMFPSGLAGHTYGPFKDGNNLYITYHRVVFRAKSPEAMLTLSDWGNDNEPVGPIGQQLMFNFVEVQPYLEK